jgi:hypothetical protein
MRFDQPLPNGPDDELTPDDIVEAMIEEDRRKTQLRQEAEHQLFKREAKRLADAMEREDDRMPVIRSLTEQLQQPLNPQLYAIDGLLPLGGNALFAGRYKAGKTTFNGQLLKAWADWETSKFLGRFQCRPSEERPNVTIFNYEMSEDQFQRWLAKVGIINTDRVNVVHLRGLSLPLALDTVRDKVAGWLRDLNTGLWIVDPASRAMAGMGDGSDNKDVNLFVGWLDEIKLKADVRDMVLNIHMSHSATKDPSDERAMGAQAWSAWADALWFLTLDKDNCRWFHADGRDVREEKLLVSYQAEDMSVALVDVDPDTQKRNEFERKIIECIRNNPGCSTRTIRETVKGRNNDVSEALEKLVRAGTVKIRPGPRRRQDHFYGPDYPTLPPILNGQVQDGENEDPED